MQCRKNETLFTTITIEHYIAWRNTNDCETSTNML